MVLGAALVAAFPLQACGGPSSARLVVLQTSDVAPAKDHKSHLAPGAFVTLTLTIRNTGPGPARGVTVRDALPQGFRYYALVTLGGNAIRTSIQDPAQQGDPQWGTWTIPAGTSTKNSELVLSFKVQASLKPGDYPNVVKLSGTLAEVDQSDPVVLTVEPRPSLTVAAAATAPQAVTGGAISYVVSVTNVGTAIAHGVAVSVALPPGFLYASTSGFEGNSARAESVDPPASSLLPVWASWNLPPMNSGAPGLLRVNFQARILPGVQPGIYGLTAAITGLDVPPQLIGESAPVAVGKGTTIPISMTVAASSPYASQGGQVTYAITVENDSLDAARDVTVTDTLPQGFTFQVTNSIAINGRGTGSRLQPSAGTSTPQWGPFTVPAGGFSGATLVISFTAKVAADAALGPHPNVVSGSSSNAQITGGSDAGPVVVTSG